MKARCRNLTGNRYNCYTVLYEQPRSEKFNKRVWRVVCDCGEERDILQDTLCSSNRKNCPSCRPSPTKSHGLSHHKLHDTWSYMRNRCNNKNNKDYKDYGGRGIKVCDRWEDFINFFNDMFPSWKEGLSIDRIDVNGDYSPENCRWSTNEEQSTNKRNTVKIEYEGKYYTLDELSKKTGVKKHLLKSRRQKGYSIEEMIGGRYNKWAPIPIEYKGKSYKNLKDLANDYNIGYQAVTNRYNKGIRGYELVKKKVIEFEGCNYESFSELARKFDLDPHTLRYKLKKGWTLKECIYGK